MRFTIYWEKQKKNGLIQNQNSIGKEVQNRTHQISLLYLEGLKD